MKCKKQTRLPQTENDARRPTGEDRNGPLGGRRDLATGIFLHTSESWLGGIGLQQASHGGFHQGTQNEMIQGYSQEMETPKHAKKGNMNSANLY